MANETISFFCPACGIKLTVPANLAGVSGPCPSCSAQIQAPKAAVMPSSANNPAPAASAPAPQVMPEVPGNPPGPQAAQQAALSPTLQAPAQAPPPPVSAVPPAPAVKPEPRKLPNRPHHAEVVAKQMPEPNHSGDSRHLKAAPLPRHPHRPSVFARFLMLILFLIASGALVFGVLTVLKMQADKEPTVTRSTTPPKDPDAGPPAPEPEPQEIGKRPEIPSLPTPAPEQPTLIEPAPGLPEGIEPKAPGMEALEVLEKFLLAKSLPERLPMIETKTPEEELAASCLAGPLPPAPKMLLEFQESNPMEEVVDFYYSVDFEDADHRAIPQTLLVRTRGRSEPKVVVDPFLDLFGGRLANYASKPTDKAGVFQVIASALASCTNQDVPDREKKLTLKLLARDNTKEIADAYFSKMSKIGEMLEDGTYSLSYAKATPCTVMLRWNTEDDAEHPYLEAIAIKALDWNP